MHLLCSGLRVHCNILWLLDLKNLLLICTTVIFEMIGGNIYKTIVNDICDLGHIFYCYCLVQYIFN